MTLVAATFAFCVACVGSIVAAHLVRRLSATDTFRELRDPPGPRKSHRAARSQLGGLAVVSAWGIGMLVVLYAFGGIPPDATRWIAGIIPGLLLVTCVGLVDDVDSVGPGSKLLVEFLATAMVFLGAGLFGALGPLPWPQELAWAVGAVLWTLGLTNATNFIDGLDGLAAGVTALSACGLAVLALLVGDDGSAVVAAGLAGVSAGFLRANIAPARLFLGDSGSLFLGMGLSVLGLRIFTYSPSWMTATSLLLVSWIAWGDFAFAILRRWHGRIAIWRADEQHLHHRLVRAGLAPRIAVASLWIVSGLAVATGIATFLRSQERVWASALVLATLPVVWAASRASGTTRREPDSAERKSAATIASNRAA